MSKNIQQSGASFEKLSPAQQREALLAKARQLRDQNAVMNAARAAAEKKATELIEKSAETEAQKNDNSESLLEKMIKEIAQLKEQLKSGVAEQKFSTGKRQQYGMTRFNHRIGTLGAMYDEYVLARRGTRINAMLMYKELKAAHGDLQFTLIHVQNHLRQLFSRQEDLKYTFYKVAPHTYLFDELESEEKSESNEIVEEKSEGAGS